MADAKSPPVTIRTIAQHVGVSNATVSSVLANRHEERRVAPATVERVRQAVRELGYVPNLTARRLRTNDPGVRQYDLGILTTFEAPLPLVSSLLREVQRAIDRRAGPGRQYSVSIDMFHAGRLKELRGLFNASRFNGVILTNTLPADDAFLSATTLPYPAVVLGRRLPTYTCVLDAPGEIGRRVAGLLLRGGRTRPVVLVPPTLTQSTADRVASFAEAARLQTGEEPRRITAGGFAPATAERAVREALRRDSRPFDALFSVTDSLALGAYQAIKHANRRIPAEIAMVGVGDDDRSEYFDPPLTCVGPDNDQIVHQVVGQLFKLMGERVAAQPAEIFVPPIVTIRDST
ncbi:LacI family DNA-binding transcriptional regulator [Opitutus sp. ER46]|uniref:LacI family DNA-binding transcriptional regulator n=1 Tax=Opitutus sp. ER46 TaxID=2161864 RepID=UPI000D31CED2|nr:LacI family DNA-binding transcriptional regulator [Opitutus sp. ER46]PTX95712.1 hypothetical protein DB354_09885 [Opitutus sp. ER46]